jgi:hypothetical protein
MKKFAPFFILCLSAAILFSTALMAQEKTEVTVKVTKDGKVVKDTTYQFEDAAEAKHALKMMEILSGEDEHMMEYNYTMAHSHGDHSKAMVFISEDGKTTEIKEFHGDSLVWISEDGADGEHVKVIRKKMKDGETFDILIDEDSDGHKGIKKKTVKVIVSGDEDGTWHVDGKELEHVDEDVYVISGDENLKVEMKEILKKYDGEEDSNVKVIVVKKGHEDCEHAEELEVEVEKKVKKKSKKQ